MHHYVHHIVSKIVCLLFVMFSGFIRAFSWKQLPAVSGNNTDESSGTEPMSSRRNKAEGNQNNELKDAEMLLE